MNDSKKISDFLNRNFGKLTGDWIGKRSHYEKEFCEVTGFKHYSTRFWDCKYDDCLIELKKCQSSMWFDEIRYSEMALELSADSKKKTSTLIIKYTGSKIVEILVINTIELLKLLNICTEDAKFMIERFKKVKQKGDGLNFQHGISYSKLSKIADYIVNGESESESGSEPEPESESESESGSELHHYDFTKLKAPNKFKILSILNIFPKLSVSEIYEKGVWESSKNTIAGRCSEMNKSGHLSKNGLKYSITENGIELFNQIKRKLLTSKT